MPRIRKHAAQVFKALPAHGTLHRIRGSCHFDPRADAFWADHVRARKQQDLRPIVHAL
jgi:hypothetical protein